MTDETARPGSDGAADSPAAGRPAAGVPTELRERPRGDLPAPFTRAQLETEEQQIKDAILRMGSRVAEQVVAAITALERHDTESALAIIRGDEALNADQRDIAGMVSRTVAMQQPVARDLRFLLTLDHVAYDLERMGDHAASVAKQARKLAPYAPLRDYVHLPEMGRLVAQQVRDVLAAVVDIDDERAREVAARDDDVDALYHRIFDETLDLMRADPANVDPGARILFAAHYLERIGDRVTNIAEDIVFLATGDVEDLNP
jgi:phosphate transport system protein